MDTEGMIQPTKCSSLRQNGFAMIQDHPCKIVQMSTSKTGKHGGAKVHLVGVDLFTEKKYEELCMSTANMNVPNVSRKDFQVIDIEEDGTVNYLDENDETQTNLKLPDLCESDREIAATMKRLFENPSEGCDLYITVVSAMGQDAIKAAREQRI